MSVTRSDRDRHRIRPKDAAAAFGALMADPTDSAQIPKLVLALQGRAQIRIAGRMRASTKGRRILAAKPRLRERLSDRAELASLPAGSLGRAYLEFCKRERIDLQLREEMCTAERPVRATALDPDERFVEGWLRDSHDLYHVVTGYRTDLVGELALLVFTIIHSRNPGAVPLALIAFAKSWREMGAATYLTTDAVRRAVRAEWFPEQDWLALLPRPLAELRAELRVGDPPPGY